MRGAIPTGICYLRDAFLVSGGRGYSEPNFFWLIVRLGV